MPGARVAIGDKACFVQRLRQRLNRADIRPRCAVLDRQPDRYARQRGCRAAGNPTTADELVEGRPGHDRDIERRVSHHLLLDLADHAIFDDQLVAR
jgi:hypothetical protein